MFTSLSIRNVGIIKSKRTHFSSTSLSMQPKTSSRPPSVKSAFPLTTTLKVWKCKRNILTVGLSSFTSDRCGSFAFGMKINMVVYSQLYSTTFGERPLNSSTPKSWLTRNQSSARTILLLTPLAFTMWKLRRKPNASNSKTPFSTLQLWSFPSLWERWVCTFCSTSTKTSMTICWWTPSTWLPDWPIYHRYH